MTAPGTAGEVSGGQSNLQALARGGRTNIIGFLLRLAARLPFLFIAGRIYGPEVVGRFSVAVLAVEFAALIATLGLKRGLAQALSTSDRPHECVVWDAMLVAAVASLVAGALLVAFPQVMFPNSAINRFDRALPVVILALAWSDVALAALAYRHNIRASVTARAIVEPWTISIAAFVFSFYSIRDGLIFSYVLSLVAALVASLIPFLRSYGIPRGWQPRLTPLMRLARSNIPLAGADAVEWATRNVDRAILGLVFAPGVVGIYYMAQQVASIPQRLKTSFDPILGPVITQSLSVGDLDAIARAVRQVGFWIMAGQAGLALMGAIPSEAVMGVVGPQFVAGAAALVFLMIAEVLAAMGAVSESALVYMARGRNLAISLGMLGFQIAASFGLIFALRAAGAPPEWQAAGPAAALALSLALTSIIKMRLLERVVGTSVSAWRWPFVWAVLVSAAVGSLATRWAEWAELVVGLPLIVGSYIFMLWRFAWRAEDKALFARRRGSAEGVAASQSAPQPLP